MSFFNSIKFLTEYRLKYMVTVHLVNKDVFYSDRREAIVKAASREEAIKMLKKNVTSRPVVTVEVVNE